MFSVPSARSCKAWKSDEQINKCFLSSPPSSGQSGERFIRRRFLFLVEDGRPVLGSDSWARQLALHCSFSQSLLKGARQPPHLSKNQGCQSQTLSLISAAWQAPGLRMVLWHLSGKGSFYSYLSALASAPVRSLVRCIQSENARKEFLLLIHA